MRHLRGGLTLTSQAKTRPSKRAMPYQTSAS